MKILFYLELHPIRDRFESFGFIGERILRMVRDEYAGKKFACYEPMEIRILLGRHYSKLATKYPEVQPAILGLTSEENDQVEILIRDWCSDEQAIIEWVDLMKGEGVVSELYYSILKRVYETVYQFDLVVNWSTNGVVRKFCDNYGLDCVSMEQGCVRNPIYNSIYIDAMGVNGAAISRYIDLDFVETSDSEVLLNILPTRAQANANIDAMHIPVNSKYMNEIYAGIGKNVLIPLQLKDDSNCILYSKYKSMYEMLTEVLPRLVDADKKCFIKPHPAANDRLINQQDHEQCKAFVNNFDSNVYWLDDISPTESYISLLQKMDCILTVNSSTGFEAMIYGKLVVALGEAPYDMFGVLPSFEDYISNRVDYDAYKRQSNKVVSFMLKHYLIPSDFAFDFHFFYKYISNAIEAKYILQEKGASEMTKFFCLQQNLTIDIKNQILAPRIILERYRRYGSKNNNTTILKMNINNKKLTQPFNSRFKKKFVKFKRDPAKFFVDSNHAVLHKIGKFLGGRQ